MTITGHLPTAATLEATATATTTSWICPIVTRTTNTIPTTTAMFARCSLLIRFLYGQGKCDACHGADGRDR